MGVPQPPARRRPFYAFGVDWSVHIPKLVDFWSRELLGELGYHGHPVGAHVPVLDRHRFGDAEVARWLELWTETVDELFTGVLARRHAERRRILAVPAGVTPG